MEDAAALYVVPTPLGNLADLTRRAEEILRAVPWVAAEDTRHSGPLLKQIGSSARTLPAHRHNEHEAAARILEKLQGGESVALISDAGTPRVASCSDGACDSTETCSSCPTDCGACAPSSIVPPERLIDWSLSGVPGGIPTDRTVFVNVRTTSNVTWVG